MKKMLHTTILAAASGVVLAGCSHLYDDGRKAVIDDSFNNALRTEYVALADYEWDQGDFIDAIHYERKIKSILSNEAPLPEPLVNRDLPTEQLNTLASARNSLVSALAQGAAERQPADTAHAQAMFDCWVEQQEENFQPEDIAKCRDAFYIALEKIGAPKVERITSDVVEKAAVRTADIVTQRAQPAAANRMPEEFLVFFDFDQAELNSSAKETLQGVMKQIAVFNPSKIMVNGHADRAGSYEYNLSLSQKRADAVVNYFTNMGNTADMFATVALGESSPMVNTEDGKAEEQNRFVRIRFQK